MLLLNLREIEEKLDNFNWNYKVGDNIKQNIWEVFFLYKIKNEYCSNTKEKRGANKHISIILISIIEAIFYDFIMRLSEATNQFPLIIGYKKREDIKKYISLQKVSCESKKPGIRKLRVRNYTLSKILVILRKFELLEPKDSPIYDALESATYFRNRIHIYNWFGNLEIDERYVFTDVRLEALEKLFDSVLILMERKYSRS